MNEVIRGNGKLVDVVKMDYKRNVMATMRWTNAWLREVEEPNQEFIFLVEK